VYSFGAVFVSFVVTGLCVYLHFAFVMIPLQRYYHPYCALRIVEAPTVLVKVTCTEAILLASSLTLKT
jgi:hypothetical protein